MTYENIPHELKELNNWCCFRIESDGRGRTTKRPYNPITDTFSKSNDKSTWVSFEDAVSLSPNYDGVGFFFEEPYVGVDLDNIGSEIEAYQDNPDVDNIVSEFIEGLSTYAEISPSGNGLHLITKAKLPSGGRRRGNVEMYHSGRYFTVTGKHIGGYRHVNDEDIGQLEFLHKKYIQRPVNTEITNTSTGTGNNLPTDEIVKIAKQSKHGLRFATLYEGDWSQFYSSQSEADMAFASDLAFWTARDAKKMDAIFRKSNLFRDKWDEKRGDKTYGDITLDKAIESCSNEFIPETTDDDFQLYLLDDAVKPAKKKKFYSYDDTGNAERLRDRYGSLIRYNYTAKSWMYYDGKRWKYDDDGKMKHLVDKVIMELKNEQISYENYDGYAEEEVKKFRTRHWKDSRNHNKKENMLKETMHLLPTHNHDFDVDFSLINVQNGYIDLNTGELNEHTREKMFTKISNTEYTDKADAPLWESFLHDIFLGDVELIKFMQRAVGYSLSGFTSEQVMFVLYGNGRNGKSVFIDVLNEVFGSYATNIRPQAIMASKFSGSSGPTPEIAKLDGARFVTTTEPNEGDRFDEGLLKQLTGGDMVSARKLHENEFEFVPQLKLWMATNHKPYVRGTDDGIWRRFVIIPFNKQIPLHQVDKNLLFKLKKELPAIMKWCVDGYTEWKKIGLAEPEVVRRERDEYRNEMDPIEMFIEECCVKRNTDVSASVLFKAYDNWAKENNQYRMNSTKFGKEMKRHFPSKKSGVIKYVGLELLKEYNPNFIKLNLE